MIATMTTRGGVGSKEFRKFVEQRLAPRLRPGHIVCLDNLNAHKNVQVLHLIEQRGARLLFLPPYSPDFNPIEAAWSKIKSLIRKAQATCIASLRAAMYRALSTRHTARCTRMVSLLWLRTSVIMIRTLASKTVIFVLRVSQHAYCRCH